MSKRELFPQDDCGSCPIARQSADCRGNPLVGWYRLTGGTSCPPPSMEGAGDAGDRGWLKGFDILNGRMNGICSIWPYFLNKAACYRTGSPPPLSLRDISSSRRRTRMPPVSLYRSSGGLPHQCAHWFAATSVFWAPTNPYFPISAKTSSFSGMARMAPLRVVTM